MNIKKISIITGCVVLFGFSMWASLYQSQQWEKFSKEHSCKVVSKTSGSVSTTSGLMVGSSSQIVTVNTYIPGKTSYLCDDGVVYER